MTPQDANRDYNLMNAKVVTPEEIRHANVALRDGQIASVEDGPLPGRSAKEIDLGGKFLLPGVIDPHVHLRDMGESEKEDFTTATACAAVGGVTTVMQMPNGIPDILTAEDFRERKSSSKIVRTQISPSMPGLAIRTEKSSITSESWAPSVTRFSPL